MTLITTRPGPGTARPYRFPTVVRRDVAGGRVVAAHLPGQNLAVALLLLDAGAGREPVGKEGLGAVLAKALEEGTAQRDATTFALAVEGLGTELATGLDWDTFQVSVQVPVDRLGAAVELLAEAVRTPRLDPDDVRRVRDDEATALRMDWANPGPRADAALRADLFGAQNRWGRPLYGDPDSVAGLDVEDVTVFHSEWFLRPGTLVVAGDLDRIDLDALGAAAFAGTGGGPVERGGPIEVPLPDRPADHPGGPARLGAVHAAAGPPVTAPRPPRLRADDARRHGAGWGVHLPAQPPDPRGTRLHVRHPGRLRLVPPVRPVRGQLRGADGGDRAGPGRGGRRDHPYPGGRGDRGRVGGGPLLAGRPALGRVAEPPGDRLAR